MKMEFIEESRLFEFKSELLKSRVAFKRGDGTVYLAAIEASMIIGFVGYKVLSDSIRLKTDYVLPQARGRGVYDQLFIKRLAVIEEKYGNPRLTAYCTEMSIGTYVRKGFKRLTQRNGITFVEK